MLTRGGGFFPIWSIDEIIAHSFDCHSQSLCCFGSLVLIQNAGEQALIAPTPAISLSMRPNCQKSSACLWCAVASADRVLNYWWVDKSSNIPLGVRDATSPAADLWTTAVQCHCEANSVRAPNGKQCGQAMRPARMLCMHFPLAILCFIINF